ncbi:MAG: hypothetical protein GXO10_03625, partial [Crenarchaeota archaeon]|nr:hypothetical protein [Thermoproteota archaeon]
MDTLDLYIIDADSRESTRIEVYKDSLRRLIHPVVIFHKICEENNLEDVIGVFQHPSRIYGIPFSSSLYVIKYSEDSVESVRVLTDISLPPNIIGIVFKNYKTCDVYVDSSGISFSGDEKFMRILHCENNMIKSNIFSIPMISEIPSFNIYVRNCSKVSSYNLDDIFIRKLYILHKYSPLLGPDGPVGRSGIVALLEKLKNLELSEQISDVLKTFSTSRGSCSGCMTACLNFINDRPLTYDDLLKVCEKCIDQELLDRLRSACDDPFFIVQGLYMSRFSYPERLSKGFEKKLAILYLSSQLLDLCPLSPLLFSKSRNFELDIPIQVLWYIYRISIDPEKLCKIVELVRPGFQTRLKIDSIDDAIKILKSLDDVPSDIKYVEPSSKLNGRKVQLALDLVTSIEEIVDIAFTCISAGVEIVEIGTPLLKYYGMRIVEQARANLPEGIIIFADTKTMDVGDLEARLAYRAGADMMSVMGIGTLLKVREAIFEAAKFDKIVLVDLMQIQDPVQALMEMRDIIDEAYPWMVICLHRGITEQLRGRGIESDVDLIRKTREMLGDKCPLAVAGGIRPGTARRLVEAGANIIIVGAAIYTARNIKETAEKLVKEIK